MRILALFDDSNRCYYHALKDKHMVISVGIQNKVEDNYYRIDLSKKRESLKYIINLHLQYKFDLILASPPCDSWSSITVSRAYNGRIGSAFKSFDDYNPWSLEEFKSLTYPNISRNIHRWSDDKILEKYNEYTNKGILGNDTADTLIMICRRLNIPFVIENPKLSRIFKYFEYRNFKGKNNIAHYNNYDSSYPMKPTNFFSSYKLNLNDKRVPTSIKWRHTNQTSKRENDGGDRSNIPHNLIKDIINQIESVYI